MINTAFNFTPRAKRLLALAQAQAVRFKHNLVATEHLLLGLLELKEGVAANVLRKMDIDLDTVRLAVERQIHSKSIQKRIGNIPYSSSSKKVLSLAEEERKNLKHSYLGTEHILLGMLRSSDTVAFRALTGLGVAVEKTRPEIVRILGSFDSDTNLILASLDRLTAQYLDEQSGLL